MRNKNLDGARGLAALSVALAHCATTVGGLAIYGSTIHDFASMPGDAIALRIWHSVFNGDSAVILFFALSGFVLGHSLERESESPLQAFFPYAVKRAFRLLPATIIAGLLAFIIRPITVSQMIGAMFIYDNAANGVLWSLQVEVIGSILIFILWADRGRWLMWAMLVLYTYLYWKLPPIIGIIRSEFTMLPVAFVLGYAIPYFPKRMWQSTAIFCFGLAALLLSDVIMGRSWHTRDGQVIGAFLIVGYLQANHFRLLNSKPVQFLGAVSYSFYLIHPLLLEEGAKVLDRLAISGPLPLKAAVLAMLTIPAAWVIASVVVRYVENPGIKLGRAAINRMRPSSPPTATP